jgi:membrane protein implicated in regulation of membrane protease activity
LEIVKEFLLKNWLTLLAFVIPTILAVILYKKSQRAPAAFYNDSSEQLIGDSAILSPHIEVKHKGEDVPRVTKTRLIFWNAGKAPIRASDVAQADPLKFKLPDDAQMINASVCRISRDSTKFSVHPSPFEKIGGEVQLRFDFLDERDYAVVDMIHTGKAKGRYELAGTIVGAHRGIAKRDAPEWTKTRPAKLSCNTYYFPQSCLLLFMCICGLLILGMVLPVLLPLQGWYVELSKSARMLGEGTSEAAFSLVLILSVALFAYLVRLLLEMRERSKHVEGEAQMVDLPPGFVLCSGAGDDEKFIDTDGSHKKAVILKRSTLWKPVPGAEYVWARLLPTLEEARKGCQVTLIRNVELARESRSAKLTLRVDDEADIYIDDVEVARGLKGFGAEAHVVDLGAFLKEGVNILRIDVRNSPMNIPNLKAEHNPSGVAYRLEVEY